jgi:hypothetical protein
VATAQENGNYVDLVFEGGGVVPRRQQLLDQMAAARAGAR